MYKNYDNIKQTTHSIHASKHRSDKDHGQMNQEQEHKDEPCSDLEDKSEGSTTIVVPFNTTQTGSFQ